MRIKPENLPLIHRYAAHGRIVVFDTETTGMMNDDEICQIAAVEYEHGRECRNMAEYLTPACPMNPYAEQAHGLSLDFLRQNGVLEELCEIEGGRDANCLRVGKLLVCASVDAFEKRHRVIHKHLPMPCAPPVTTTTLSLNSIYISSLPQENA